MAGDKRVVAEPDDFSSLAWSDNKNISNFRSQKSRKIALHKLHVEASIANIGLHVGVVKKRLGGALEDFVYLRSDDGIEVSRCVFMKICGAENVV